MTLAVIKPLGQSGNLCLPLPRIEPAVCLQREDWCQRCSLWKNEPGSVQLLSWISQGHFLKSIHPSILSQSGVDIFPFHIIPAGASHQTTLYEFIQHIYDTMQCRARTLKQKSFSKFEVRWGENNVGLPSGCSDTVCNMSCITSQGGIKRVK